MSLTKCNGLEAKLISRRKTEQQNKTKLWSSMVDQPLERHLPWRQPLFLNPYLADGLEVRNSKSTALVSTLSLQKGLMLLLFSIGSRKAGGRVQKRNYASDHTAFKEIVQSSWSGGSRIPERHQYSPPPQKKMDPSRC